MRSLIAILVAAFIGLAFTPTTASARMGGFGGRVPWWRLPRWWLRWLPWRWFPWWWVPSRLRLPTRRCGRGPRPRGRLPLLGRLLRLRRRLPGAPPRLDSVWLAAAL